MVMSTFNPRIGTRRPSAMAQAPGFMSHPKATDYCQEKTVDARLLRNPPEGTSEEARAALSLQNRT